MLTMNDADLIENLTGLIDSQIEWLRGGGRTEDSAADSDNRWRRASQLEKRLRELKRPELSQAWEKNIDSPSPAPSKPQR